MKIAMIGSGAAGSVFASYLRRGGADMTLVDVYKAHMDKVAADGMTFRIDPDQSYHLDGFKTAYSADEIGIMDAVIFLTKATQLENAIIGAAPCIGPETVVISLINGLGNEDKLLKYHPANRCMIGSGSIGTVLDGPGMCTSYPNGGVVVNFGTIETSSRSVEVGKQLEKYFNEGGAKAVFREDILPLVWWKVIKNSSHSPVSAVLRLSIGDTDRCQYGRELYNRVIREGVAVAKAKGIQIMDADEFIAHDHEQCLENGPYVNSMTQDVCWKKLPTEVDMLCGALSEQGKLVGVPTPTCDVLTLIIKSIERNYDNQLKDKPV
jgi:2-dehydropantoate 2-reductase